MRIALVLVPAGDGKALGAIGRAMASAFEAAGATAEILDPVTGLGALHAYDFIVVGSEGEGLMGRLPARLGGILGSARGIGGKRGMAVLLRRGLRPERSLKALMAAMEAQGLRVTHGETVRNGTEAATAAREAPVERNR